VGTNGGLGGCGVRAANKTRLVNGRGLSLSAEIGFLWVPLYLHCSRWANRLEQLPQAYQVRQWKTSYHTQRPGLTRPCPITLDLAQPARVTGDSDFQPLRSAKGNVRNARRRLRSGRHVSHTELIDASPQMRLAARMGWRESSWELGGSLALRPPGCHIGRPVGGGDSTSRIRNAAQKVSAEVLLRSCGVTGKRRTGAIVTRSGQVV